MAGQANALTNKHTNPSPTFPTFPGGAVAVTPSDTTVFTASSVIYVGTTGNVAVTTFNGDSVTFNSVAAGTVIPVQVVAVKATGTTASNMVAIY